MFADISFFNSLGNSGNAGFVANSELLSYLKEYAEKSTGALLCQQWLDSIRDRSDVTADLTARLSDASHDYDKEKAQAASKLKEQMMDGDTLRVDAEDKAYISSLDPNIGNEVKTMLESALENWKQSMKTQLAQGDDLQDLLGENGQVMPQPSPLTPPAPSAQAAPAPAPQVPEMMPNNVSAMEY